MKRSYFKRKPTTPMKRTRLKKVGKKTLHKKAWDVFSKWVRNRDKRCVCCGSRNNLQAGHFHHGVLDFDEMNINAQCARCNKWLHGNLSQYSVYLINKYGQEAFNQLDARHWLAKKGEYRTQEDYNKIIEKYQLSTLLD